MKNFIYGDHAVGSLGQSWPSQKALRANNYESATNHCKVCSFCRVCRTVFFVLQNGRRKRNSGFISPLLTAEHHVCAMGKSPRGNMKKQAAYDWHVAKRKLQQK